MSSILFRYVRKQSQRDENKTQDFLLKMVNPLSTLVAKFKKMPKTFFIT